MRNTRLLSLLFCLLCLQSVTSYAQGNCIGLISNRENTATLYSSKSQIATPESLDTVTKALETLEGLISLSKMATSLKGKIYAKALPEIEQVQELGREILKTKANDQDRVFQFFSQFLALVDLAKNFGSMVGEYADGFDRMREFNELEFQERLVGFANRYGAADPFEQLLPWLIENKMKASRNDRLALTKGFNYISIEPGIKIPDMMTYSFQHKFVFKEGVLTLVDLFKDRETGISYLGVSLSDKADYDGQHGDAEAFLEHDLIHAYTQKYLDHLLFEEFKAKTMRQKIILKKLTNQLLQNRIREYQAIEDRALREAIEVLFFMFLHEQSRTYPIGVEADFQKEENEQFYRRVIIPALQAGRLGEEYMYLIKRPKTINTAFEWLKQRALEDAKTVR